MSSQSVLRRRLRAQHLDARLPPGSLATAAAGGLQDSAPRSGLLSLHARCRDVGPDAWERKELCQVWGPRAAVYLVPRSAMPAFTVGRLPRDPATAQRLLEMADRAASLLGDGGMSQTEVETALGASEPGSLRWLAASGRLVLRWDTRTTVVRAVPPPAVDPDEARIDLARRFVAWFGRATAAEFAAWAGVHEPDAADTLAALGDPKSVTDEGASSVQGVRLLPPGDPYLFRDRRSLVADTQQFQALFRPKGHLAGALLVDGRIVGTWSRQQRKVTVRPWEAVDEDRLADEVDTLAEPLGGPVALIVADLQ